MKNTLRQIFHSTKFVIGFAIFLVIFLTSVIYPIFVTYDPLEMVGNGNFFKPGTYISQKDTVEAESYTLKLELENAGVAGKLTAKELEDMRTWLSEYGEVSEAKGADAEELLVLWEENYNGEADQEGMLASEKKAYERLDAKIQELLEDHDIIIASKDETTGELKEDRTLSSDEYANLNDIGNKRTFLLGTDNFGRDVLTELIDATLTSLKLGLMAGIVATLIGLLLGLLAGYLGGFVDDLIMFITNLFTVIPSFVLLILISYSVGQDSRSVGLVAVVIGLTSWPWTTRSVRSQVISLRNRDHVNLSKLSGHSMLRIILTDILPYIASYVVMAFILQISSGILSEAQLSMLGLGPATTKTATLGLMMNWAMLYSAHLNGSWWAYFPVVLVIALISFSMNLMNTGLDQVFNPQLRD